MMPQGAPAVVLPPLRGRVQAQAPLAPTTWFRVGGPAEFFVRPADVDDLLLLLRDSDLPITVIGAASNLLVRDGGVAGVVVRLGGRAFGGVVRDGDGYIAGAAALDATVAEQAAADAMDGLAFLSGIPGTIGGAVAMNAGAYGSDISQVLDWAEVATPTGLQRVDASLLSYRHADLPARGIVVRARLRAHPGDPSARMAEIRAARDATQPVRARTGGSTFANPPGHKAWALIDAAGCRGMILGQAQVSPLHCNFLLNLGGATAAEIEGLGEAVRETVHAHSGIDLRWEIRRIGEPG
ncbi:UDP-N-acetylmuramate dehydrogenase [Humitalea sp. 24SJ18S-53]|uniref:UDP-N-acetylmuramate dehydrogenase n=1 Tax=Humitalea sp. 24SJ18S-53 TaxID=3422307 RepID=UPI003D669792